MSSIKRRPYFLGCGREDLVIRHSHWDDEGAVDDRRVWGGPGEYVRGRSQVGSDDVVPCLGR